MQPRRIRWIAGIVPLAVLLSAFSSSEELPSDPVRATARGFVFHDRDGDGQRGADEPGLPGVRVSNGRDVVRTDAQGSYRLEVDDDCILFVIKPSGWRTPVDEHGIPRFYFIHKPGGSPESRHAGVAPTGPLPDSVDFALSPQEEPEEFEVLLFGDPQPRDRTELDHVAHDVLQELVGSSAAFGVTLGDILFDDLSMYDDQTRAVGMIGIPWYNVIGNHDLNFEAREDRYSDETFERHFGPSYYSFDHGAAHFLVLDDVHWYHDGQQGRYRGGLGERQLAFIANDLAAVPEDRLIVLMMHIPLENVGDRQELYRLIESRPATLSISGHTHHHEHRFLGEEDGWKGEQPHHHVINVTVSGSWWAGAPDDRGIPHATCSDGTPNGYTTLCVDGRNYRLRYKAAGRPADLQMRVHAPKVLSRAELDGVEVFANVFNAAAGCAVRMRVDGGAWQSMEHQLRNDPAYEQLRAREMAIEGRDWRDLPRPKACPHLWVGGLPEDLGVGTHLIEVQAEGLFGESYEGRHSLRVTR